MTQTGFFRFREEIRVCVVLICYVIRPVCFEFARYSFGPMALMRLERLYNISPRVNDIPY